MPSAAHSATSVRPLPPAFGEDTFRDSPYAVCHGTDQWGPYVELDLGFIKTRMRAVAPGQFMMGSPGSELGRREHETYHQVTLTRRFWLCETACPQRLWKEVMGSHSFWFPGDDRPVEMVCWNDTQDFMAAINRRFRGLKLRLPTEAEWEYACRANTQTPFSFGETITPVQVNYNGNFPYAGAEEGLYRTHTVNVKTLPPNPWGFYEMHGNTWEWTHDFYQSDLGTVPVIDPRGPADGTHKVMRGACWFDHASTTRSADRDIGLKTLRIPFLGFRFARDDVPFD